MNAKRLQVGNHGNRIMVAEHGVDVATQLFAQTRHAFEAGHAIAVSASAVVARQHTKVIVEVEHEFSGPAHGGAAYVRVQVTQVQNGEAIESTWQIWEADSIAPEQSRHGLSGLADAAVMCGAMAGSMRSLWTPRSRAQGAILVNPGEPL